MERSEGLKIPERKEIGGMRVLVVDDYGSVRNVMQKMVMRILGSKGLVEIAEDGEEALGILRKEAFQLVISDGKMPKMNGVKLAEEAIKLVNPPLMFVLTSTDVHELGFSGHKEDLQRQLRERGVDIFIEKPISFEKMKELIGEVKEKLRGEEGEEYK
ncbi:MAG TPA: response regulator [Patescibacteria group bacterium]|nr:response regulator [Patescibacteria group bacterium]